MGYITKGRGVSVHCKIVPTSRRCSTAREERKIDVEWNVTNTTLYPVELEVEAKTPTGLWRQ